MVAAIIIIIIIIIITSTTTTTIIITIAICLLCFSGESRAWYIQNKT